LRLFLYFVPAMLANFPFINSERQYSIYGKSYSAYNSWQSEQFLQCLIRVKEEPQYVKYLRKPVFKTLYSSLVERNSIWPLVELRIPDSEGPSAWTWAQDEIYFSKAFLFLLNEYIEEVENLLTCVDYAEEAKVRLALELLFYLIHGGWRPESIDTTAELLSVINVDRLLKTDWQSLWSTQPDIEYAILCVLRSLLRMSKEECLKRSAEIVKILDEDNLLNIGDFYYGTEKIFSAFDSEIK